MNFSRPRTLQVLFAAPLLLWLAIVLHVLRLSTAFNWMVKHFTPFVVFGILMLCPLAAAWLGWRIQRRGALIGGLVLFAAFVAYPGIPLIRHKLEPRTPVLPGHPGELPPLTGIPVFPGAEGFGTRTRAGRGGQVIEVTSLADHGPGTLRAAIEVAAPRTIVFRTGGIIALEKQILVTQPFVTIAGQTAPGDGICLKDAGLVIATHDVLVQHLRVRPGDVGKGVDPDDNDAITILGTHGKITDGAYNVVIDHVSASWGEDETISTWFGAHDVTVSWCIVSEGLNSRRHHKGGHSTGLLIGDSSNRVSVHHTLLAHNGFRNPLISKGGTHDIVNNVIYDWGNLGGEIYDEASNSFVNWIGNWFRDGPSTEQGLYEIIINSSGVPKLYVEGNRGPHRTGDAADEWSPVSYKWNQQIAPAHYRAMTRFATWPITTTSAEEAMRMVLAQAGATLPKRDAVDTRIVADVKDGTGKIINNVSEVGGHPKFASGTPPADSDHDGIPDEWEMQHGLDPHNAADGKAETDGYTNLEKYLHSIRTP
jgi:hypothetical protein